MHEFSEFLEMSSQHIYSIEVIGVPRKVFIRFNVPLPIAVVNTLLWRVFKPWIASHVFTQGCPS